MAQPSESDFGAFLPERKSPFPETFNKRGVRGRSVLITGAGGSIGSALADKIVVAAPRRLILLDHSEQALSELRREHRSRGHLRMAQFILADVRDDSLIESLFAEERPEIIFHAAAFKHVPLLEENPFAAVENNALATWRLAHSAAKYGVARLMLVSTDKAANPRSMLGVSKRLAELAILRWDTPASRMTALRLGNVAGSSGSVLPAFREQIRRGGPVAVTHSETTRYFLTMEETCSAIGALASVEDASGLFVPEMGKPISI